MSAVYCLQCGEYLGKSERITRGQKFCNSACRVAYHRAKSKVADERTPQERATETKRNKECRSRTCPQCGMYFFPTAAQGKKKFCSDKCKMAYHRARDWSGKYHRRSPGAIDTGERLPVKVVTDDRAMVNEAWSGALDDND